MNVIAFAPPPSAFAKNGPFVDVEVRHVYGVPKLYPMSAAARALAGIAGTKTLEPRVLREAAEHLDVRIRAVGATSEDVLRNLLGGKS